MLKSVRWIAEPRAGERCVLPHPGGGGGGGLRRGGSRESSAFAVLPSLPLSSPLIGLLLSGLNCTVLWHTEVQNHPWAGRGTAGTRPPPPSWISHTLRADGTAPLLIIPHSSHLTPPPQKNKKSTPRRRALFWKQTTQLPEPPPPPPQLSPPPAGGAHTNVLSWLANVQVALHSSPWQPT